MFQLIYASTATRQLDEKQLRALVAAARERNEKQDITGVLVHRNGSFLHVLEGSEDDVRALYECIRADDRHQWVTLLKTTRVEGRDFPDAPLAFRDRSVAGVRQQPLDGNAEAFGALFSGEGAAHETLLQFQRANRHSQSTGERSAPGSASEAAAS